MLLEYMKSDKAKWIIFLVCVCTTYLLTWIHDDEDTKQQHSLDKSMTFIDYRYFYMA